MSTTSEIPPGDQNPLLIPWSGPYGGVPAFTAVRIEHFEPAVETAMAEYRAEVAAIVAREQPPAFNNTIEAFENAGRTLRRVRAVYHVWESTLSTPEFQGLAGEMAPRFAAFDDEIIQNERLFQRIDVVYRSAQAGSWDDERRRLAWRLHTDFVLAGAQLNQTDKAQLSRINQRLAALYTTFKQNVLHDEAHHAVVLESEDDLAGLPVSLRASALAEGQRRGLEGMWVIANTRSSVEPFLTFSDRRALRQQVWQMFVHRGDNGDDHDNNPVVSEILQLRAQRARLLGYESHAHWHLQDAMAKTPEAAIELMEAVWRPALQRVRQEVADMQAIASQKGAAITIEPWDYRYYAEKVRKQRYDLDESQLRPYLQMDRLREAMFWVAGQLFGLSFSEAGDVSVYHPDVRVWRVQDGEGEHVGLWFFDPYARQGKLSGAWMSSYRDQECFAGKVTTIVSNNANFVKPRPGEATLLSWDDATTLFHEFGHALHGLCSNVRYPSLSGTGVAPDYVEFPSQLLEHWLSTREVLDRFALHVQTGRSIPEELVERIECASHFNQGFDTVEYLATALVDMQIHLANDEHIDPKGFEREALRALKMPPEIVMRHRIPHLSHAFASDAYSAGYYSYLWADTLTADAFEAFNEATGAYDKRIAERLKRHVFQVGNTVDPACGYRAFRGRDPETDALMRKRGLQGEAARPEGGGYGSSDDR